MAAALTIAALLLFSVTLVRVASVAMRITGLPEDVARFQCVSALTGAGFTTSESEMVVNYPVRRKIAVALMILGNLGLISTSATLIVSFVGTEQTMSAILTQAAWLLGAVLVIALLVLNRTIDRVLCAAIAVFLRRFTGLRQQRPHRLLQVGAGYSVFEQDIGKDLPPDAPMPLRDGEILLGIRRDGRFEAVSAFAEDGLKPGDHVIWFGRETEIGEKDRRSAFS